MPPTRVQTSEIWSTLQAAFAVNRPRWPATMEHERWRQTFSLDFLLWVCLSDPHGRRSPTRKTPKIRMQKQARGRHVGSPGPKRGLSANKHREHREHGRHVLSPPSVAYMASHRTSRPISRSHTVVKGTRSSRLAASVYRQPLE